jgi:hypothetical protein
MQPKRTFFNQFRLLVLANIVLLASFGAFVFHGKASPASSYYYRFTINSDGSTNVEINFSSTDSSGSSWVVIPKLSGWNYTFMPKGASFQSEEVPTTDVGLGDLYFYQVFSFSYRATSSFSLKVEFGFENGGLIIDDRGIFFSPQIGYEKSSATSGTAEVLFDSHLTVNQNNAMEVGSREYTPSEISSHRAVFDLPDNEDLLRLQIEFQTNHSSSSTTLTSRNNVFTFTSPSMYAANAQSILNLFDRLYSNYTQLFNVTLTPPIGVQFFLPSFEEFLSLGGFTPFTAAGAGKININIFFIRAVNGTIEVIAAHELVHHFLIKAGLSPNSFLWFHEGMAQYISVTLVERLGYEGAKEEGNRLEQNSGELIQRIGERDLGFVQNWNPSISPPNVGDYYTASYYVVSRIAQNHGELDYYSRFFRLMNGVNIDNIDVLALYLSRAANASVALPLQEWGFNVIDLYTSSDIREKTIEAQRIVGAVNPLFQPYKALAEFVYRQALLSFERGDNRGGMNLLQFAITIADLAPLLTLLTIAVALGIIVYAIHRHRERVKMRPSPLPVPPLPPEIFPKSAE